MISKNTRGSEWHKWDLHLHTPSSYDYKDKSVTNENIIDMLDANQIRAVAITDHHVIDIERIQKLQDLGHKKGICVLPGIEFLSDARGSEPIHFIGIFAENAKLNYIWSQIKAKTNICRIEGEGVGINSIYCNLAQTTDLIHELGGIVTIHAGKKSNSVDNISHTLPQGDAQKTDIAKYVDIFEVGKTEDVKSYKRGVIPCLQKTIKKTHPIILCSDNHDIKQYSIKQNCWIKAALSFEGLKQVVYEPEMRIAVQEEIPEHKSDYHIIDSISFDNEEMGVQTVFFNQNLNTVIGGRSSGKSLLLGCLTRCNDKDVSAKTSGLNERYNRFVERVCAKASVKWRDGSSESRKIIYYSQSMISEVVRENAYGISGINDLVEKIVSLDPEKKAKIQEYNQFVIKNQSDINSLITELCNVNLLLRMKKKQMEDIGSLEGIKAEIKKLNDTIIALKSKMKNYLSEEDDAIFKKSVESLQNTIAKKEFIQNDLKRLGELRSIDPISSTAPNISGISDAYRENLLSKFAEMKDKFVNEWRAFISTQEKLLNTELNLQEKRICEIKNSDLYKNGIALQEKNEALSYNVGLLEQEETKLKIVLKVSEDHKKCLQERDRVITQLWTLFSLFDSRSQQLASFMDVCKQDVEISANPKYRRDDFYRNILKNVDKRNAKVKLIDSFVNQEDDAQAIPFKDRDLFDAILMGEIPLKADLQQVLTDVFAKNYFSISYEVKYGGDYLYEMSEGKKAYIVLRLLLDFDDGTCPIIIDQPEDDLDNRAIYGDLVKYIREQKVKRQIILATHNPNIVVGADAELVIVANQHGIGSENQDNVKFEYYESGIEDSFNDDSSPTLLLKQGVRQHICDILEGGEEAFAKREQKYSYSR